MSALIEEAPEGQDVPLDESSVVVEPEDVQEVRRTSDLEIGGGVRENRPEDYLKSSPALRPWRSKVDQASLLSLAMGLTPFSTTIWVCPSIRKGANPYSYRRIVRGGLVGHAADVWGQRAMSSCPAATAMILPSLMILCSAKAWVSL